MFFLIPAKEEGSQIIKPGVWAKSKANIYSVLCIQTQWRNIQIPWKMMVPAEN